MPGELTIDLGAITDNYRRIVARAAPAEVAAVVKADAYGLGMASVAPTLWAEGARRFFVAHIEEGIALRGILPDAEIFILSGMSRASVDAHAQFRLIPVLNSLNEIGVWTDRARMRERALPAMIHIDTGMNRLGLDRTELARLTAEPERLAGIDRRGWMSHLATADQAGHPLIEQQRLRFTAAIAELPAAPASLANSAGIWRDRALHFDLVRPGAALYGLRPLENESNPMRPVIRLTAPVLQVRSVDTAEAVGYGATYIAERPTKIATISVGYSDGFLRSDCMRRQVRIGSSWAPVVGRVSMDLITVDISAVPEPVHPGTMVELIGDDHDADALAAEIGTNGYEVLTALGPRFKRHYIPANPAAVSGT